MQALSQQEIELLSETIPPETSAPGAGRRIIAPATVAPVPAATGRAVKHYDFRRPDKFSKDHLRALRSVFGSFAALLASGFGSYLRTNVQARLSNVEQVTYDDYLRGLASPTILYIVTLAPLPGQIVLELDLRLSRAILDRLLGGSGQPNPILRELTEIELALLRTIRAVLAGCLREAWSGVYAVEPDLREPTLSPEFVQVTLPGESTIRLALEVALLGVTGHVTLCLPYPVLQPVLD
ncbi:MAG: hypothetical protein IT307_18095, partial [Chloroflexi bacterium]|nr:hypothetical protein [Chloroflexota bacterium]